MPILLLPQDDPRQKQPTTEQPSGSLLKMDAERHTMKDLGPLPVS